MDSVLSLPAFHATTLDFEKYKIPVRFDHKNRALFFALPLCSAIGFRRSIKAVRAVVPPENLVEWRDDPGSPSSATPCVDEIGMRKLVAASPFVRARRFSRWAPSALSAAQWSLAAAPTQADSLAAVDSTRAKQPLGTRTPSRLVSVPAKVAKAASDFAFHAFFDGPTHIAATKPSPSIAAPHDVDDVVARIPREAPRAQIPQSEELNLPPRDDLAPPSVQTFSFLGGPVRALRDETRQPWFVMSDVARLLGFSQAYASGLVPDAQKCSRRVTISGAQCDMDLVSESGLSTLIARSRRKGRKPYTQEFRAWIAEQVIHALATLEPGAVEQRDIASGSPCAVVDGMAASKAARARFVLDLSDPDKPSVAPLTTSDDVIDLNSDAWIEKVFASATQSQLKRVLRAVAARLV